jgi:HlyD family secretion protein
MTKPRTTVAAIRSSCIGLCVLLALGASVFAWQRAGRHRDLPVVETARVTRADVDMVLTVGGEVEPAKQTRIECELENIPSPTSMFGSNGLTIIGLIADGAQVKKGDVLCQFDSSSFRDMLRQQQVEVQRAQSDLRKADLDLDTARMGVRAFEEGEIRQEIEHLQGEIALKRADLQRARQRLEWMGRMKRINYVSAGDLARETRQVLTLEEGLKQAETAQEIFKRYTAPRTLRELQVAVAAAAEQREFARLQLDRQERRMEKLGRQVEECTVRAPHAGLVAHADVLFGPDLKLREGIQVHQHQPLFFLPDLSKLEVVVSLHESVADRVRRGMRAKVRMPAFPGRELTGKVGRIEPLPTMNWRVGLDVKHFVAKIELDQAPAGVLLDMSAEVQIVTGRCRDALIVPAEALTLEGGREYCYVASSAGLERREVRLARADREILQVVEGLEEGEQVVLQPWTLRDRPADALPKDDPPVETAADGRDWLEWFARPT